MDTDEHGLRGGAGKSGGGPPQSKTLARLPVTTEPREASWSAPVLWRFGMRREGGRGTPSNGTGVAAARQSAANCDGNSNGGFLPKAATPIRRAGGRLDATAAFRMPQGQRGAPARRTKLGDDGNLMKADGNSFPVFILGWTTKNGDETLN